MDQKKLRSEREQRLKSSKIYYRFQPKASKSEDRISTLSKEEIWVSDPTKFNDPLDLNLLIYDDIYKNRFDSKSFRKAISVLHSENSPFPQFFDVELRNAIQLWIDEAADSISVISAIKHRLSKLGVICLTPILNNSLMWAHYSSNHEGFVVEYSIPTKKFLDDECLNQDFLFNGDFEIEDVHYTTRLPHICISEILCTPRQAIARLLQTKSIDWAYEKEFRLVFFDKKHQMVPMPKGMEISALIAGEKITTDTYDELRNKAEELEVPFFKMRRQDNRYSYELSY